MSNTVAGRRQFDNSQECIAKKRQWRHHANENTPEQNASIGDSWVVWEQSGRDSHISLTAAWKPNILGVRAE